MAQIANASALGSKKEVRTTLQLNKPALAILVR
jgi:hypothetical protein